MTELRHRERQRQLEAAITRITKHFGALEAVPADVYPGAFFNRSATEWAPDVDLADPTLPATGRERRDAI